MEGKTHHLFMKRRRNIVVALEDLDFIWDSDELRDMVELHNEGKDIEYMAWFFNRDPDEVFIALFHLARKGKIERIDLIGKGGKTLN